MKDVKGKMKMKTIDEILGNIPEKDRPDNLLQVF